jgi:hypothetical protein
MRELLRGHMRGLAEKICSALQPSLRADSSALVKSPAIEVWIPTRTLPSCHAGACGSDSSSRRYSSDMSYGSSDVWEDSVIPDFF